MKKFLYALAVKKALLLLVVVVSMLWQQHKAYAQALPAPVANFVVNRAVAGVITKVAIQRGFAANDPRILATMAGVGTSLTAVNVASTAAGVALTVAGAPVWLTVAAGLGILAVGAAIVAGNTSLSIVPAGPVNKLQVMTTPTTNPMPYMPPAVAAGPFDKYTMNGQEIYRDSSCYSSQPCYQFPALPMGEIPIQWRPSMSPDAGNIVIVFWSLASFTNKFTPYGYPPGVSFDGGWYSAPSSLSTASWVSPPSWDVSASSKRLIGTYRQTPQNAAYPPTQSNWESSTAPITLGYTFGPALYNDLATAQPALSPSVTSSRVDNATLAKLVDQSWQRAAAQPGYTGLPYSVSQPVTAMDVSSWAMENPMAVPTIGDLLTPANNPGTNTVPVSTTVQPSTSPGTDPYTPPGTNPPPTTGTAGDVNVINTPNVNVVNNVKVDLGPNPNIAAPTLEGTPTASSILQPILNLMPGLKNFAMPSHTAECPKPTLELFEKSITMDTHCKVTEAARPTLQAIMAAVWVALGVIIILGA